MRRQPPRKGIVLLMVISLLTLLIVVGVTFMLVSNQFRRAGKSHLRAVVYEADKSSELIERGVAMVMSDTPDVHSPLRAHGLLRDVYGADSVSGTVLDAQATAGGQLVAIVATADWTDTSRRRNTTNGYEPFPFFEGVLNGRVITFLDGDARMVSTRIVDHVYNRNNNRHTFRVMRTDRNGFNVIPSQGSTFLINGQAFSGMGAGFNPQANPSTGPLLNRTVGIAPSGKLVPTPVPGTGDFFETIPTALLINWRGEPNSRPASGNPVNIAEYYAQGHLDESYDSPDFQNVFLAAEIATGGGNIRVIPSYHRPALVNYFVTQLRNYLTTNYSLTAAQMAQIIIYPFGPDGKPADGNPATPDDDELAPYTLVPPNVRGQIAGLMRKIVMRPLPQDHPNFPNATTFTASLMSPTLTNAWDVDTDGDGIKDSVWIDIGLPVRSDRHGRRYKPLFAFKIIDMDGRLNLNTAGTPAHVAAYAGGDPTSLALAGWAGNTNAATGRLPAGMGYGPAEINLYGLFNGQADYRRLMLGDAVSGIAGRYGAPAVPGRNGFDTLARFQFYQLPVAARSNYYAPTYMVAGYQSPHDLRGEFAMGVSHRSGSLYERRPAATTDTISESPYELSLVHRNPSGHLLGAEDTAYTPGELERILRANDSDASTLPSRLWELIGTFRDPAYGGPANATANRRLVTTASFDMPVPIQHSLLNTGSTSANWQQREHIAYFLRSRIRQAVGLPPAPALLTVAQETQLTGLVNQLLAPEFFRGHRMDVNRPFGNGRDDNNNQVVDEVDTTPARRLESRQNQLWLTIPPDFDNDGQPDSSDANAYLVRYHYARHLYVLALLFNNSPIDFDRDGNTSQRETAYGLAQWAINVVDFRDADACMTPFEFDLNPFNGWNVDGNLMTAEQLPGSSPPVMHPERAVVWGMERPEMLISEVLAFHDLRVEDLNNPGGTTTDQMNPDPTFDQRLRPRGATFIELYNPWTGDERGPAEFYYDQGNGAWRNGLILNKRVPGSGDPVWRIIVTSSTTQPDPWNHPRHGQTRPAARKSVYFTNTPSSDPTHGEFFTSAVGNLTPLAGGRYAVVGSSGQTLNAQGGGLDIDGDGNIDFVSPIGRLLTAAEGGSLDYLNTRHIRLSPGAPHQVVVANNTYNELLPPDIQNAVAVPIGLPRSFNVSEPVGGYPADAYTNASPGPNGEEWMPDLADYEGAWQPPLDRPLDLGRLDDSYYPRYVTVHLQRLANPLIPWHEDSAAPMNSLNPYVTIDSYEVDLFVFNGLRTDPNSPIMLPSPTNFFARQRGDQTPAGQTRSLWYHEVGVDPPPASVGAINNHVFDRRLRHSLSRLNQGYGNAFSTMNPPPGGLPLAAQAYMGFPDAAQNHAFPWLPWNNRPFVSAHELMLVPHTYAENFARSFQFNQPDNYANNAAAQGPYHHLINFYATSVTGTANRGPDLYRLFELLYVPSRYVGSQMLLPPRIFHAGSSFSGTGGYFAPYNFVSAFRDPGRINLNTISHQRIYEAIFDGGTRNGANVQDHPHPTWADFQQSRRGSATAFPNMDPSLPTFFARPFRGAEGRIVPLPNMRTDDVDATLMRREGGGVGPPTNTPLFGGSTTERFRDARRHAYFRHQPLIRMENLVSTRSNVYAAWVMLGFFEVEPVAPSFSHPDGYALGRELGSDTGEVRRHRAFYLLDRSIPAAFDPGKRLNTENCVLSRRFIE